MSERSDSDETGTVNDGPANDDPAASAGTGAASAQAGSRRRPAAADASADAAGTAAPPTGVPPTGAARARARQASRPARAGGGLALLLGGLALLVGAVGLAAAAYLWRQHEALVTRLTTADAETGSLLESLSAEQVRAVDQRTALLDQIAADRDTIATLRREIGDFPVRIAGISRRVDALQGRSLDARDVWLTAEAEYYLVVANAETALAGRADSAATALELADGLLRELGDPALNPVRNAIADELARLRAVASVDREGVAYRLAGLAARVPDLPLRAAAASGYDTGAAPLDDVEPGLTRLWETVKQAVGGLVRVERRDAPVATLLSAGERSLIRRQVELELQLARAGLLNGEPGVYLSALEAASVLVSAEFDVAAAEVSGLVRELAELSALDVAPDLPDISGSLALLRSARTGGAGE